MPKQPKKSGPPPDEDKADRQIRRAAEKRKREERDEFVERVERKPIIPFAANPDVRRWNSAGMRPQGQARTTLNGNEAEDVEFFTVMRPVKGGGGRVTTVTGDEKVAHTLVISNETGIRMSKGKAPAILPRLTALTAHAVQAATTYLYSLDTPLDKSFLISDPASTFPLFSSTQINALYQLHATGVNPLPPAMQEIVAEEGAGKVGGVLRLVKTMNQMRVVLLQLGVYLGRLDSADGAPISPWKVGRAVEHELYGEALPVLKVWDTFVGEITAKIQKTNILKMKPGEKSRFTRDVDGHKHFTKIVLSATALITSTNLLISSLRLSPKGGFSYAEGYLDSSAENFKTLAGSMYLLQQEANIAVLTAEGKAWGQVGGKEEGLPFTNTLESLENGL